MEFQIKPLSSETVPGALERAKNYRLLNEPEQAESICLDILRIDPNNQEALVVLVLALTDEFTHAERATYTRARELLPRLHDEYQKTYYTGIICERRGRAHLKQGSEGSGYVAYDGEALRNDEDFSHVAAWGYTGQDRAPVRYREPLMFEFVTPTQRSYK